MYLILLTRATDSLLIAFDEIYFALNAIFHIFTLDIKKYDIEDVIQKK